MCFQGTRRIAQCWRGWNGGSKQIMKNTPKKAKWRCELPGCRAHKAEGSNVCSRHLKEAIAAEKKAKR